MDDSTQLVDEGDLDTFSTEFFGTKVENEAEIEDTENPGEDPTPEVEVEAEVETETEDEEGAVETESDPDDEAEEPESPKKKNRTTAKERINELVAERRAVEARAAAEKVEYERRIADMEARLAKPNDTPEDKVVIGDDSPNPNATDADGAFVYPLGEFDPQFVADMTRHLFRKEAEAAKSEMAREAEVARLKAEDAKLVENWEVKLVKTEEALPDLREKMQTLDTTFRSIDPELGYFLSSTIMSMEKGPEILYYLADNIGEAQKIVASGPTAAAIALGRLEGQLSTKVQVNKETKVSKAPAPPVATRGTGVSKTTPGDTDDLEAFEREFFRKK